MTPAYMPLRDATLALDEDFPDLRGRKYKNQQTFLKRWAMPTIVFALLVTNLISLIYTRNTDQSTGQSDASDPDHGKFYFCGCDAVRRYRSTNGPMTKKKEKILLSSSLYAKEQQSKTALSLIGHGSNFGGTLNTAPGITTKATRYGKLSAPRTASSLWTRDGPLDVTGPKA